MKKKLRTRIGSMMLAIIMVLSLFPVTALADEEGTEETETYVAQVGETPYTTLETAINSAVTGDTVKLLANVERNTALIIQEKSITLDLNGKKITGTNNNNTAFNYIQVWSSAGLIITDTSASQTGSIELTETGTATSGIVTTAPTRLIYNAGSFTLQKGTLKLNAATSKALVGLYSMGTAAVEGGTIQVTQTGTNSQWEVCGVYQASSSGGDIAVSGGTIKVSSEGLQAAYGVYSVKDTTMISGTADIRTTGTNATSVGTKGSISGGTFSPAPSASLVDPEYELKELKDGIWTLQEKSKVAEVNGVQYATLAEATNNVASGGTITLLCDFVQDDQLTITDKTFTLNMAGKTITLGKITDDAGAILLNGSSNVTITGNGGFTFNDDYFADSSGQMIGVDENATLTIENGNFYAGLVCVRAGNNAKVYIKGGAYSASTGYDGRMWLLNLQDNEGAAFFVSGGIFTDYDPSNSATENPEDNFCAAGYITTSETVTGEGNTQSTCYTVVPAAAEINGTYYATLETAIAKVQSGETIKLMVNVTNGSGIIVPSGSNFTIDFDGHTYTVTNNLAGSTGTKNQCFQLLKGSTVTMKNGAIVADDDGIKMIIQNYANLTLDGMTLDATKGTNNVGYVMSNNCGNVTITGDTDITAKAGNVAFDMYYWPDGGYGEGVTVTVDQNMTGTITGNIEYASDGTMTDVADKEKLNIQGGTFNGSIVTKETSHGISITGGTFSSDPTAYKADGYIVKRDGTSAYTYTVLVKSNLTSGIYMSDPTGATASNYYVTKNNDGTWTVYYSAPSGGGSSSGGSSSSGTTTETEKNPDGSTTTTVTKPDGTVTETTKNPDGSSEVIETKKDGTVTTTTTDKAGNRTEVVEKLDGSSKTTVDNKDGSSSTTTVSRDGQVEAEVKLPTAVIADAADKGEAVTLPMPEVPVTSDKSSAPTVTVDLSSSTSAKVEIPVEDVTTGTVAVLVKADGTEEVIKTTLTTESGVAITLSDGDTVKIVDNSKEFDDVSDHYWGNQYIDFATSRELFSGTSESTFSPEAVMTRGMIVTVLASYDGADTSAAVGETWYAAGQQWAVENGVSDGTDMSGSLNREQLAVMLWSYAGKPTPIGDLSSFADADSTSDWAVDALAWAVENGLISGMDDGTLNPQGNATRAQVATIMTQFVALTA